MAGAPKMDRVCDPLEGICDTCGAAGSLQSCRMCGARVCSQCFESNACMCRRCLKGRSFI